MNYKKIQSKIIINYKKTYNRQINVYKMKKMNVLKKIE